MTDKVLILYTYCENQKGILANSDSFINLKYFLDNGLINDNKYLFCININGIYSFDFDNYLKKFNNLKIFEGDGTSALHGYLNILDNIKYKEFKYFFFITDKVSGPYNKDIVSNWIDFYIKNVNNNTICISAYGTSPMGKLYKFPYISMKFMCINIIVLNLIMKHNFFNTNLYDTTNSINHTLPKNIFEIKLSYFLLNHNINYIAITKKNITDLNILNYYNKKDFKKLLEINKQLHIINDIETKDRIFWTGKIMNKLLNNKKFNKSLLKKRDITNISYW